MVDVDAQITAVTRRLETADRDGALVRMQSLVQRHPAPLEDVWEAASTAEGIASWFLPVEGELRLGGRYQLIGNAGGTVQSCTPPRDGAAGYRATWEFGGGVTWIEVSLRAIDEDTTEFSFSHTGPVAELPPGFWETYGPGATGVGWDQGLLGLALHLDGGETIAPDQAETWMLSDEGRRFARLSADAWAAAHVADGGAQDEASRAADAAFAFYTGGEAAG